jgi:hypothetical protein
MGIRGGRNLLCSLEALQSVIWTCLHICICIAMGFVCFLARFSHLKWGLWTISMNYLLNFLAFETSLSMLCSFKWGFFLLFVTCVIVAQVLCSFPPWNKRSADREMEVAWRRHWFWKRFLLESIVKIHQGNKT